jgi:S1-C subfamily serine protease
VVAGQAHDFFNPLASGREAIAKLIDKPYYGGAFDAWNVGDFAKYIQKIGMQPGEATSISRVLAAMESAGLLMPAGWDEENPLLGQRYIAQGVLSAQKDGYLWLSEVLGADLIIEAYRAVTVQISGGDGAPWGTGLVLDHSHIVTNKHVVRALAGRRLQVHSRVPTGGTPSSTPHQLRVVPHPELDVAVIEVQPPEDRFFTPLRGMVFRDPAWADEVYVLGYPRVPWMIDTDITLQRGEVVNPLAEAPPVRDDDTEALGIIPSRTKMFLYSAIARPGNSGGPIVAHDGRVIGLVVEDSAPSLSSDPTRPADDNPSERFTTLRAAMKEAVELFTCSPASADEKMQSAPDIPDAAPFYRGIPSSEVLRALVDLGFGDLAVLERPGVHYL